MRVEVIDELNFILYLNNNYYMDMKNLNDITIFEYTNIMYGDIVNTIFDYGKKININV